MSYTLQHSLQQSPAWSLRITLLSAIFRHQSYIWDCDFFSQQGTKICSLIIWFSHSWTKTTGAQTFLSLSIFSQYQWAYINCSLSIHSSALKLMNSFWLKYWYNSKGRRRSEGFFIPAMTSLTFCMEEVLLEHSDCQCFVTTLMAFKDDQDLSCGAQLVRWGSPFHSESFILKNKMQEILISQENWIRMSECLLHYKCSLQVCSFWPVFQLSYSNQMKPHVHIQSFFNVLVPSLFRVTQHGGICH